ncbi:Imm70 family immunity protein [Fusobacterium sp. PH5-44]|uniref:Imm70 family immunity protein n=1 Tax=unclassified Fusobacterium TaxID=2648384 RepID=UPI003D1A4FEF
MGLYLCIFDKNENEIEGVEVGRYEYFGFFREKVEKYVENGEWGSVCSTLMWHKDSEGIWTPENCVELLKELDLIRKTFVLLESDKKIINYELGVIHELKIEINNLYDCFLDVDGENLIERLEDLCRISIETGLNIEFQ